MHERLHNAAESRRHRLEGSHQCNRGVAYVDIQGRARVQAQWYRGKGRGVEHGDMHGRGEEWAVKQWLK